MTTIKSYTDIEQSKKLAEFLPYESADMYHFVPADNEGEFVEKVEVIGHKSCYNLFYKVTNWDDTPYIPCWSLAALLDVLKDDIKIEKTLFDQSDMFTYSIIGDSFDYRTYEHENLIDACYEMIIKSHELNLL